MTASRRVKLELLLDALEGWWLPFGEERRKLDPLAAMRMRLTNKTDDPHESETSLVYTSQARVTKAVTGALIGCASRLAIRLHRQRARDLYHQAMWSLGH